MTLSAQKRDKMGTRNCRQLRAEGYYPAVVYGVGRKPLALQVAKRVADSYFKSPGVKTHPFSLEVDGKAINVLVKSFKLSTADQSIQHIDFWQVSNKTEVSVDMPLVFINEQNSPGVKEKGVVEHTLRELPIKALPKDIPDALEVDMANMAIGDVIHLSELEMPIGVTLQKLVDETHDPIVVAISAPRLIEEEPEPELEASEEGAEEGSEEGAASDDDASKEESDKQDESKQA